MRSLVAFLALALAACGGGSSSSSSPPGPQTIADPFVYLAQSQNPDGNVNTPLHDTDPITYRRMDYGGSQASDSFRTGSGAITTWSYSPFGVFVPADGDGGETYVQSGDTVYIGATQDGSSPNITSFGQNWPLFRVDATSEWRGMSGQGYTQYQRANVSYPNIGSVDSIVSEHYYNPDPATSRGMERFFLGSGWGRLVWQKWGPDPALSRVAARCPDFGWNSAPVSGWYLEDCRENVNIVSANGSLTGAMEWHP